METLYINGPHCMGDVTLFAIEQSLLRTERGQFGIWLSGAKQLYAIIICDKNGQRAVDINSGELDLAAIIKRMPELDRLLEQPK